MHCWRGLGGTNGLVMIWLLLGMVADARCQDEIAWPTQTSPQLIEQWPEVDPLFVDEEALLFAPREGTYPAEFQPRETAGPPGQDRSPLRLGALWVPSQNVRGQGSELSFTGLQASLAFPLYIEPTGRSIWLAMTNLEHLEIGGNAILPDSGTPLPADLWKLSIGTLHSREFDNGWRAGFMFNVGSASDRPFAGIRDMTLTTLGFLNVPSGERDAWSFSLFYSPTSQLPFPIPGVAYVWRPSDQFTANIGIPFSLRYQPTETFTFTASYLPLTNVALRGSQRLGDYWNLYASYQIVNETYWLSERVNTQDRLYLFDQRVGIGLERELAFGFKLDLAAAYLFDRRIFQAESFSDARHDVLDIEPGPAVSLLFSWSR
ncbi:hypothetical protein ETAA8_01910 [Anatilimnocola aggregata]|uniref:DUF6268 domain-containing protein n=1 Tax=Anatilimnocola aggregata TaxID=2528021 RepID=A0A517Y4L9_9BACT|nr:DUF6268 family outer membrane beta-barrel protein [Anatilimnocola aggregata]QDU25130.1 hypothetical protein ETAA8_01910 [Anatilimnocola aggregata]